ncbi:uncharacterized protein [Ptychodera flava]|uniref:uncharacterized protein n=1 Tax=Ptychodera flava TaxID=63121 RepID=UPI003969F63F
MATRTMTTTSTATIWILVAISLCNNAAIGQGDELVVDPLLYREINMFTGICWQTIKAEAGIVYTRHVEFGIDLMVNLNCKVTLTAPYDGQKIILNFITFDVPESDECETDRILIYDGENIQADLITPATGACGESYPETVTSRGNSLTVQFVTNHNDTQEFLDASGIVAYFTAFLPKNETTAELEEILPDDWKKPFCCHGDRSMCFPSKYTCDGFQNCNDNSDETLKECVSGGNVLDILSDLTGLSQGVILGLFILLLLLLLLILSVIIYVCCCRETKKVKKRIVRKRKYVLKSDYEYDDYRSPYAAAPYDLYYNTEYIKSKGDFLKRDNGDYDDEEDSKSKATFVRTDEDTDIGPSRRGNVGSESTLLSTTQMILAVPATTNRVSTPTQRSVTSAPGRRVSDVEHNVAVYGLRPGTGERGRRRSRSLTPQGVRRMVRSESGSLMKHVDAREGKQQRRLRADSPIILPRVRAPPMLNSMQRRASFSNSDTLPPRSRALRGDSFSSERGKRKFKKTSDRGSTLSVDQILRRNQEKMANTTVATITGSATGQATYTRGNSKDTVLTAASSLSSVNTGLTTQPQTESENRLWWTTIPAPSMSRFHSDGHLEEIDETLAARRRTKRAETLISASALRRWASDIDFQGEVTKGRNLDSLNVAHRWLGSRAFGKMDLGVPVSNVEIVKLDDNNKTEVLQVSDV